jgi:hypothetical protein
VNFTCKILFDFLRFFTEVVEVKQTCSNITMEISPNSRSTKMKMPVKADLNQAITIRPSKFKSINGYISLKKGLNQKILFSINDPVNVQTKVLCRNVNVLGKFSIFNVLMARL